MTARETALAEVLIVARALEALGRPATIEEVARQAGLDRTVTIRRLKNAGPFGADCFPKAFTCDRRTKTWGLSHHGRELLKGEK